MGSNKTLTADVRLIAATNKNLEERVKAGAFREDLFFRLRVVEIRLPPLRERLEDIPLLARAFLREFSEENGKPVNELHRRCARPADAVSMAGQRARAAHGHRARRGAVPGRQDHRARLAGLAARGGGQAPAETDPKRLLARNDLTVKEAERELIIRALKATDGNRTLAAKKLGMSRRTFHRKLHQHHLEGF